MLVKYKSAQPSNNDRWREIDPSQVYDHDFNGAFKIRALLPGSIVWKTIKSYEEFKALMPNYALAEPEAGEVSGDAINPSHYKQLLVITDTAGNHIDTLQWLEHLQYKPYWRNNMKALVHAVRDMCADKYLSRMGMKDDETQEMEKALWYYKFATAVMKNGYKPIRVADIEMLLSGRKEAYVAVQGDHKIVTDNDTDSIFFDTKQKAAEASGQNGYVITTSVSVPSA